MKRISTIIVAFATTAAWAALPPDFRNEQASPVADSRTALAPMGGLNGIYKFKRNTEVIPKAVVFNGQIEDNIAGVSIDVSRNEAVAVEFLNSGDVLMTLRLPQEEIGKVPEQLILSPDELKELGLSFISIGNVEDLKMKESGYVATQVAGRRNQMQPRRHRMRQESSRRGTKSARGFRRDRNGRIAGGGGNCVAVVKALTGFVGTAGNGVGMASALLRRGWRSISFSSRRAGTVCSWSGGFHGKGHVGYFDGSCFVPTYGGNCGSPGKNYRLRSCVTRA